MSYRAKDLKGNGGAASEDGGLSVPWIPAAQAICSADFFA